MKSGNITYVHELHQVALSKGVPQSLVTNSGLKARENYKEWEKSQRDLDDAHMWYPTYNPPKEYDDGRILRRPALDTLDNK